MANQEEEREEARTGEEGQKEEGIDFSGVEMRVANFIAQSNAETSDDADVHTETAMKVFGVTREEVTSEMRRKAKAMNFGVIYRQNTGRPATTPPSFIPTWSERHQMEQEEYRRACR